MPQIVRLYINTHTTIYCWHITENLADMQLMAMENKIIVNTITSAERMLQRYAWRMLLYEANGVKNNITYINNKPLLHNGQHLSVSHTNSYAFVMLSTKPCGVDAEIISPKAERVKNKFCNTTEQALLANVTLTSNEFYTLLWAAKETVYKRYNYGYSFKNEITIMAINENTNSIAITISTKTLSAACTVYYLKQNEMYITYTL
jgi:4'-phosphopantetheinyl transferase